VKERPQDFFRSFAAHIVTELRGNEVLTAVQNLYERGDEATKGTLTAELKRMGFTMPTATTKHTTLLNWLRKAQVLPQEGYQVDHKVLGEILGAGPDVLSVVDELSQAERYFLRALARQAPPISDGWLNVSDAMRYAESLYPIKVPADQWQAKLLKPLQERGWIQLERRTTGRGAKSGRVKGTERFSSEYVAKLLEQDAPSIPPDLRKAINKPLPKIIEELGSPSKNVKGGALELLALRLAQLLDLAPRKWRVRSNRTGGAEVDVVAESARLVFTRWQVQCKNTLTVHVDDLAKEVGLAVLLKSQVVMIVTTGKFSKTVRQHARLANESTAMQVVTIDGRALEQMAKNSAASGSLLTNLLQKQAAEAMLLKQQQLFEEDE
jgi:hypothetical protein